MKKSQKIISFFIVLSGITVALFLFLGTEVADANTDGGDDGTPVTKEKKSSSPFLKPRKIVSKDVTSLPVNQDSVPKILDNMAIRMPQEGKFIGRFTRETTVYESRHALSVVYPFDGQVKTLDGSPFMGVIDPPEKIFRSELPQPGIEDALYITGVFIGSDEEVVFDPPALIRVPLKQQQYKNDKITAYFYNNQSKQYVNAHATLTEDGKGVVIPFVKSGYYGVFTSEGKLPQQEDKQEEKKDDTRNTQEEAKQEEDAEIKKPKFVISDTFFDIADHWGEEYIETLHSLGLAVGKTEKIFGPDEPATRAEIIAMIIKRQFTAEEISGCLPKYMPSPFTMVFFTDVQQDHKYASYICMAAIHKMTKGLHDGTFAPDRPVTRAEALKLLYESVGEEFPSEESAASPFADVSMGDWFAPSVIHAVESGITKGFTEYIGEKPHIGVQRLHRGDHSAHVELLQQILVNLQFYAGEIDGILDDEVTAAVMQYQLSRGIINTPADANAGNVGPGTIARLNEEAGFTPRPENSRRVFRPHEPVTRAELAKFAVLIFGL